MATELLMSDMPESSANYEWNDEWQESTTLCPDCKTVYMWQAGWYDGGPDEGGACIGTKYGCGNCGTREHY